MNRKSQRAEIALHRARVSDSFQELLAGTEDLLRSTASYTGSEIEAARERLKRQLAEARESAGEWKRRLASAPAAPRSTRTRSCTSMPGNRRAWPRWWGCCWMLPGLGRPALNDRGGMSAAGRLPPKALGRGAGRDGRPPAGSGGRRLRLELAGQRGREVVRGLERVRLRHGPAGLEDLVAELAT